ncbi:CBS domain-containing protein [Variovorax sp. J22R24]|uniref:CBS domain-containing protein n=1 Tax=Variovorax gracilis TaxID=3053502 RepID=UPI0025787A94|nr:CBS domain-containing protein [Variovorax sp. J22R24]MDM0107011.1 CBS domain-containing protein [Variovorax sp. J22R24]
MKPVSELLKRRDSAPWCIGPDATVFEAIALLARFEVGALMVVAHGKLVGVVSERDYTRKVGLQGRNSKETKVSDIMTPDVMTVTPASRTRECMTLMSQKRIRHLPVVDGDNVIGMISIRDLMDDIIADHEQTIDQLRAYIQS